MKYRLAKISLIIGKVFFVLSIILNIYASQPCSNDGCMIRLLYLIGVPLLLISILMILVSKRIIKNYKIEFDYSKSD